MVEVEGTVEVLQADLVLLALGFLGPEERLAGALGIATDPRSNFQADTAAWETSIPVRTPPCCAILQHESLQQCGVCLRSHCLCSVCCGVETYGVVFAGSVCCGRLQAGPVAGGVGYC